MSEFREQVQVLINETRAHFREEMGGLLNAHSLENDSDTPDFILAMYIDDCLRAFSVATRRREKWYGKDKSDGTDLELIHPTDGWDQQSLVEQATEILRYIDSEPQQALVPHARVELLRRTLKGGLQPTWAPTPPDRVGDGAQESTDE